MPLRTLVTISPFRRRVEAEDRLRLEELLHARPTPLATIPGLLVSTERSVEVTRCAVEVDAAGADAPRHASRPLVAAGDAAGESERRIVGDAHGVVVVLVADDDEHGPEDLLAGDRHVVRNVREDR